MTGNRDSHDVWLAELAKKVARRLAEPSAAIEFVFPLASVETYPWTEAGRVNGWGVDVATMHTPRVTICLWVDTYLHSEDRFSLGCWAHTTSLAVAKDAAKRSLAIAWPTCVSFTGRDRDPRTRRALLASDSALRTAPETPILDSWRREHWFGRYLHNVTRSKPDHVVGRVLSLIGELAALYGPLAEPLSESLGDLRLAEASLQERRLETYTRLARSGQADFRAALRFRHGSRCVVTGCAIPEALEAAHIAPFASGGTDNVDNGLLLRADLHLLFDNHQLWFEVDGEQVVCRFSREARQGGYSEWDCRPLAGVLSNGQREALKRRQNASASG